MQTTLILGLSEGGVGDMCADEVGGVVGDSWSSDSTTTCSVEDSGSSDNSTTWWVGGAQLSSDRVETSVLVLGSSSARKSLGKSSRA